MSWEDGAERLGLDWRRDPQSQVMFDAVRALVERLVSGWPRRGQRVLEVGCGEGLFLDVLWQDGFDVTGMDPSPAMLMQARSRLGKHADLHLGQPEHLPFEDNEYDFVILLTVLHGAADPMAVITEATRVARKGLLIGYLNPAAPVLWRQRLRRKSRRDGGPCQGLGCILGMVARTVGRKPYTCRSVLAGPRSSWRKGWLWRHVNQATLPCWMGAYGAVWFDLTAGEKPLTPILSMETTPDSG